MAKCCTHCKKKIFFKLFTPSFILCIFTPLWSQKCLARCWLTRAPECCMPGPMQELWLSVSSCDGVCIARSTSIGGKPWNYIPFEVAVLQSLLFFSAAFPKTQHVEMIPSVGRVGKGGPQCRRREWRGKEVRLFALCPDLNTHFWSEAPAWLQVGNWWGQIGLFITVGIELKLRRAVFLSLTSRSDGEYLPFSLSLCLSADANWIWWFKLMKC